MTKRKYLRLVSTGMVALGTLALGTTAILPMSLLVKATDGNTPVVGNKDDLDSIEATGKEAYTKAQAAAAKVKTSTENAQTKRQEAEAKKQTQQTDAAAKNDADENAKTAKANADNDAKTEKQTKKQYEDTRNAALKKNMSKDRRDAIKSVLNNIKKDNKVKADKADVWDNYVKELDDNGKELTFSAVASKFCDLLNDDDVKGSLRDSIEGLMDNHQGIKDLKEAYNQAKAKAKAAVSADKANAAEQTANKAKVKAEASSKAYQTSNEAANQAETQLSTDRAAAAQADEAYAAAKESLAKFAEGKKLTKVAADVRADKTSTFEQLVAKVRNALPKDTAPVPAPNPDPSGQGDNPAEPANPANPADQTNPSKQGDNPTEPANPVNPNPADSAELKPTEPTGSDQQKPEGDQKHGKYGAPNTGYEF